MFQSAAIIAVVLFFLPLKTQCDPFTNITLHMQADMLPRIMCDGPLDILEKAAKSIATESKSSIASLPLSVRIVVQPVQ
jgi:hypothetical protein